MLVHTYKLRSEETVALESRQVQGQSSLFSDSELRRAS